MNGADSKEEWMAVRAKFRLNSYTTTMENKYPHEKEGGGTDFSRPEPVEKRTLNFTPVGNNGQGSQEDKSFWDATPSGSLQLGVVNQAAWEQFELNAEYYLDFTKA